MVLRKQRKNLWTTTNRGREKNAGVLLPRHKIAKSRKTGHTAKNLPAKTDRDAETIGIETIKNDLVVTTIILIFAVARQRGAK